MAGPLLTRAKRFHHFHTSFKSTYDGSETFHTVTTLTASADTSLTARAKTTMLFESGSHTTLHPEGNLNASPDGTFHVKQDTDFNDKSVTGIQGGNVFHARKATVNYSDFTATSYTGVNASQQFNLFLASPGMIIIDCVAYKRTPFWCASGGTVPANASSHALMVGDSDDENGYGIVTAVNTPTPEWYYESVITGGDKGVYLMNASGHGKHKIYTASKWLKAKVLASSMLASMTQGAVDYYFYCAQCE